MSRRANAIGCHNNATKLTTYEPAVTPTATANAAPRVAARADAANATAPMKKAWLLAIPHYVVIGLFLGGTTMFVPHIGGLVGILVIVAAVVLLFTGRYPATIYDLVVGLNRWVLRVAAYAALMTDAYPPFRLDMGPHEP